jgi:membrane-bound serine protease (ClpP class)
MVGEAFQPSFGVLGIGGLIAFATGSVILIDTDVPGYGIDIGVIAGFTVSTAAFFILALGLVFKARRHPIVSGYEQMIGSECEALEDFDSRGRVRTHSEIWMATTTVPIKKGQRGRVEAIDGLIVKIKPY